VFLRRDVVAQFFKGSIESFYGEHRADSECHDEKFHSGNVQDVCEKESYDSAYNEHSETQFFSEQNKNRAY